MTWSNTETKIKVYENSHRGSWYKILFLKHVQLTNLQSKNGSGWEGRCRVLWSWITGDAEPPNMVLETELRCSRRAASAL